MKEIHVNAYTKSDGTHVKEHYRTIDSNGYTITPGNNSLNFQSNPVLTGRISMDVNPGDILEGEVSAGGIDWGNIGSAIAGIAVVAANVAIKAAPIALKMYQATQSQNTSQAQYLKPQLENSIMGLEDTQKIMKQNLDNKLEKLTSTKSQNEYANLYKSFAKENETYKKTAYSLTKIKHAAEDKDYETVMNELDNYKNLQNNVISDSFMNNQVDLSKMQSNQNTQQYKPDLSSMNYAPVPSPYQNANTQPDWRTNQNNGDFIQDNPQLMKKALDIMINSGNKATLGKYINDGTQFWNASTNDLNNEYMNDNGITIQNIHEIPSHELKIKVASKLKSQKLNVDNTKGVIFYENSDISKSIANSVKFKEFVNSNKDTLLNGQVIKEGSINYPKSDPNLWGALGKVDIMNTYIDGNGNIISTVIDTYEFNPNDPRVLVRMGKSAQDGGLSKPYFTVIAIKIPKAIWLQWK